MAPKVIETSADGVAYSSTRQRLYESIIVLISVGVIGGIAIGAVTGGARIAAIALAIVLAASGVYRAWRVRFAANAENVSIQNYWRGYEFVWADVTDVVLSTLTMGVVPQTAIGFLLRNGRGPRAQATPANPADRAALLEALKRLAPGTVTFHDER